MSDAGFWRGENGPTNYGLDDLNADLDRIFALVSNPRRRALLYLLSESDEDRLWTANLAVRLADLETDGDPHEDAEEVAVTLRHNHLPKLAKAGIVDVDSSMTTLSYEGDDRLDDLLRWSRPREDGRTWLHLE